MEPQVFYLKKDGNDDVSYLWLKPCVGCEGYYCKPNKDHCCSYCKDGRGHSHTIHLQIKGTTTAGKIKPKQDGLDGFI